MSMVCDIEWPGQPSRSRLSIPDVGTSESHISLQKLKKKKDTALLPDISPSGKKKGFEWKAAAFSAWLSGSWHLGFNPRCVCVFQTPAHI